MGFGNFLNLSSTRIKSNLANLISFFYFQCLLEYEHWYGQDLTIVGADDQNYIP